MNQTQPGARSPRRTVTMLSLGVCALLLIATQFALVQAEEPAHDAFRRTWERTDKPVADRAVDRTWMWGPKAFTGPRQEAYAEAPEGERLVQYYDKARMEITQPDAPDDGLWYVSNGLLVVELVTGRMQTGDTQFVDLLPAQIPVAGDLTDTLSPTYATFASLMHAPAYSDGEIITLRVDRTGQAEPDPELAAYGATAAHHVVLEGLDHQVASPFWTFMNSQALVYEDGQLVTDALFENAFYPTGYPIAEAYWATVTLAGVPADVLIQCFERRCLTYTPGNAPGWEVEAGNVGRHYEQWRYVDNAATATPTATTPSETSTSVIDTPTASVTNTATTTATATRTATATATRTPTEEPTETPDDDEPTPTPTDGETHESGRARKTPWSGHWFPSQSSASLNMYDDNGPLAKYDAYVEATRGNNPGAQDWEEANHSGGQSWWGHCHAWAAASVLEPEPKAVTKEGIQFRQDDIEGMLIETYYSPGYRMWGLECNGCAEGSPAFRDVTPAEFDQVMREEMGEKRNNVVLDLDPETPVWNYPAYAYSRDSVIENGVETVTMRVTISVPRVSLTGNDPDTVTYTYTLRDGTSGQWTGGSVVDHPDFLWVIKGRIGSGGSNANPKVDYSIVKEIAR